MQGLGFRVLGFRVSKAQDLKCCDPAQSFRSYDLTMTLKPTTL